MADSCPCGSREWEDAAALRMRRCPGCGLLAPVQPPDRRALESMYAADYWSRYHDEQTGTGRDNLYAHVLNWLERTSPRRGTVLDVGCGGGAFLSLCLARGWKAVGIELSRDAVAYARGRGLDVRARAWPDSAIADGAAEAVTFINVLDHLPDPFAALREAERVLAPGGLLYIRVLNAPLHAWVKRSLALAGLDQVAVLHVYGFSRRSLSLLLPRFGFVPLAVRTAPPARGHAYSTGSALKAWGYRVLKLAHRLSYGLSHVMGLDRLGWGASLEVLARKTPGLPGAHL